MDPGTPGLQWTRHAGLVHNLLDFAHQNVNDAFLAQGAVERPRKRPLRRLPWAKGPRRPTRPQEPFKGPRRPRGHYPGDPQRLPAGQCLLNMPTRPPGEAPRRPPKSPAGDHPGGRHKLPGKLQRALTGPQDTTQESPPKDTAGQCLLGLRLSVHEIGTKSTAPEGIKKRYSTTCVWCIGCSQNTYEPNHNKNTTQQSHFNDRGAPPPKHALGNKKTLPANWWQRRSSLTCAY